MTGELTYVREADAAADLAALGGLGPLFDPRGIVVVGASTDPAKLGGVMAASLVAGSRPVALVNSRGGDGMYTSVAAAAADASAPLDLAVLCVPAAACAEVLYECAGAGVRAALVCAGGFAEAGGDGVEHQRRLVEAARATGIRLLGPNTSGFFVPPGDLRASFVPGVARLEPGRVAVVAASGGLNHALAFALQRQGVGVSLAVGIGAGLDVGPADVLEHLASDPGTGAVMLHLETVTDGPRLLAAVRTLSAVKPVVALVVGQHDIGDFAQSHTGALATSWRTTRAVLRQAGAVVVDDEDQLAAATSVLAAVRARPAAHPGAALVTAQAGPGLLIADSLHSHQVAIPELTRETQARLADLLPPLTYQANPVDTGRPGPRHGEVLAAVAADPGVDVIGVYALTEPVVDLPGAVAAADLGDTVTVVGLDGPDDEVARDRRSAGELGVPAVVGARALSSAIAALAEDARLQHASAGHQPAAAEDTAAEVAVPDRPLSEAAGKDVLAELGIDTPARSVCASRAEARAALRRIGGPVAVKLSDAAVLHKSEQGGVHLGITSESDLDAAISALEDAGAREFLVEAMAPSGVDLVVGARRDPVFGPIVLVGVGGIATEVYGDVAIAAVPATTRALADLADQLGARQLLDGFRGAAHVDRVELGRIACLLGSLLLSNPHLIEIEVNPLRAHDGGLTALDAVVVRAADAGPHATSSSRRATTTRTRERDR